MTQLLNDLDAIKQAAQEGYGKDWALPGEAVDYHIATVLQDPAFWTALGKARGWRECEVITGGVKWPDEGWAYHALRYFDTVRSGGNLSQFWQSLP